MAYSLQTLFLTEAPSDVEFTYTNYKGVTAKRRVSVHRLEYGMVENYHPVPCFLLTGYDLDKKATRSFDLSLIDMTTFKRITY